MTDKTYDADKLLKAWVKPGLYKKFARIADQNHRSLAGELKTIIEQHVKENGKR